MKSRVAIVGGGITGLTAAFTLLRQGIDVSIFEAQSAIGGLSATQDFGVFRWDRFYHCILTSDQALLQLIDELGLSSYLRWQTTEVGFYSRNALYRMTSPADLLRFPCLPLSAKIRFGLGILYAGRICNGDGLETVPLKDWILRVFGETLLREIWDPLLRCKLGDMRSEASASFLWSTIRRLYSTRGKGIEKKEQLGYVEGGYRVVLDSLVQRVRDLGGKLHVGARSIGLNLSPMVLRYTGREQAVNTMPVSSPLRLLPFCAWCRAWARSTGAGSICPGIWVWCVSRSFYATNSVPTI